MCGPDILFVLGYNCSLESSRLSKEEDVPESSLFIKTIEIARLEMDEQSA